MLQEGDPTSKDALGSPASGARFDGVPLFPLAGVVHFPHAVLPLHIFEPRYRAMVADSLAGDRLIAMALPRGDDTTDSLNPAIHPIVCIGRIIKHERLADGRYHLLLEGQHRAEILSERPASATHQHKQYRVARLRLLTESNGMEIDLERHREKLRGLLMARAEQDEATGPFLEVIKGPTATNKIADLLAFHLLENVRVKQAILSDRSVPRRVSRLLHHLQLLWQPPKHSPVTSMN